MRVMYGSWFDHIRDWYSHKDELNMLFVTYEDMQKDIRSVIGKVASFLNKKLDGETLESIVDRCTFAYMKTNPATNYQAALKHINHDIGHYFRKGSRYTTDNKKQKEQMLVHFQHRGILFISQEQSIEHFERVKEFEMDPDIPLNITYPKCG
ncbi:amine sulfotransferase-like isoform X1 [Rhincodon typus]|uniref:amine sulfotransferase-like isoform X1 n=1 Tax=Rhincodon typus TaxID=259920 RepID=UPI00202E88A7|nr:amine sulfotransferase-like isoform X1 [Rhincodon typus]